MFVFKNRERAYVHMANPAMVSIIMPNYRHAAYLRQRLDSVFAQDYPNIEIILLDDASTDDSDAILQEYASRKQVKAYIRNEHNSGNTFLQWKKGFEYASGEYIWIAESDDVAAPNLLSTLVRKLDEGANLAFCASEWIDSNGTPIPRRSSRPWNKDFRMDGLTFAKNYLLGYNYICNASAVVWRKRALANVTDTHLAFRASGDRLFWIELAMQGDVCYVAEKMNYFRQHTQKVSAPANKIGLNIVQDHDIYTFISPKLALSSMDRRLICGYHMRAIMSPDLSEEGRLKAAAAWQQEKEFCRFSLFLYMLRQAWLKIQ